MTKGPNRQNLDSYLDTALGYTLQGAGRDWTRKAKDLQTLSDALGLAAGQAELQIGEQTLTGPALRAGMEKAATSMSDKSDQLRAAGDALVVVGQQINDTKDARDSMADIGAKPAPYQAPANTSGIEPTAEEIQAQADASAARQAERSAWQSQYDKQEAKALALTKEMDAAFLGAIPPMKEIHGQEDPTEPPPNVPSGPGGTYLPGTSAPPPTGGGTNSGVRPHYTETGIVQWIPNETETTPTRPPEPRHPEPTVVICNITPVDPTTTITTPPEITSVLGNEQSGVTYQPTGPSVSTPTTSASSSAGVNAAALGAAGAAGGVSGMAGAIRAGSAPAPAGSAPARPIGSTARSASAGALSRSASAPGSAAARAGAPGAAGARGAATGSSAARGAGSAGGRGSSGGRGAASGSSAGSRSGGRGASGARGAAGGGATGRGGRKGDRDRSDQRDGLVYDQDWLGDEDVAPGVLD